MYNAYGLITVLNFSPCFMAKTNCHDFISLTKKSLDLLRICFSNDLLSFKLSFPRVLGLLL